MRDAILLVCAHAQGRACPYQSRHAHARYRRLKVWTFISLRSVNRTYAYAHWWSNIHYRYGEKCSKTRINSKDSCHSSTATIMDTSVADLTATRLLGAARFLSRRNSWKYFYSHILLIHLRQQRRCESRMVTPPSRTISSWSQRWNAQWLSWDSVLSRV